MGGDGVSGVGESRAAVTRIRRVHGKVDVRLDGELVASHQHLADAHLFPDLQDLMEALNKRISG